MSSISNIISRSILGKGSFCVLCFKDITKDSMQVNLEDEIIMEDGELKLQELLEYILKKNILENVDNIHKICSSCQTTTINCYRFIKMCEENYKTLTNSIISLSESLENVIEDFDSFGTLYVTVDTQDFSTKQYYDDKHAENKNTALSRLPLILNINSTLDSSNDEEDILYKDSVEQGNYHKSIRKKTNIDIPTIPTTYLIYKGRNCTQFQCKTCLKAFRTEVVLRKHYFKTHYPKKFKCSQCAQSFISKEILKEHNLEYHDNKICHQCGKQFKNKYNLAKHIFNHQNIKCEVCGQVFRSTDKYNNHLQTSTCRRKKRQKSTDATYYCDYCNKKFCVKPYLAKHIKFEHENAEGFTCKFCDKKFYTPSLLACHIVKHTLEKNHICGICSKKFGSKMALLYHTRLHTGETPYKCEYCDKSFISASRRLEHTRRHHLEPSLECKICSSKFKTTGSLLKHRKRHSNPNSRLNRLYIS